MSGRTYDRITFVTPKGERIELSLYSGHVPRLSERVQLRPEDGGVCGVSMVTVNLETQEVTVALYALNDVRWASAATMD